MKTAIAVSLIIFAGVCLNAYLSLWNAINDIKNSLDYIKSTCNNDYEIKESVHILRELISELHKDILTEIACLATKNNEDIKRMGGKFEQWDVISLNGKELLISFVKTNADGQPVYNCVDEAGTIYTYYDLHKFNDIKFVKHAKSPFGEN